MLYVDFSAGNKDYKLRLNTRNTVLLEKQLGCNPLSIFGDGSIESLPTITVMVYVLHSALQQYHHGITLNDAYDIFDKWLEDGHATTDFIPVLMDLYQVSGIIPSNQDIEDSEKN